MGWVVIVVDRRVQKTFAHPPRSQAELANVVATKNIVKACPAACRMIHMSTDWVYSSGEMLKEEATDNGPVRVCVRVCVCVCACTS
jgi:dTDP-4-dehydrorhamnose reductase